MDERPRSGARARAQPPRFAWAGSLTLCTFPLPLSPPLQVFTKRAKKGVWDLSALVDSGGMPSSHSALAVAVTAAAGRTLGLASATFAVALCYALVVMYDAAGVRRHAGKQAEVLNVLLTDVVSSLQHPEGGGDPHPISSQRLKEVLGHTPRQVAAGAVLGLAVGLLLPLGPGLQAV